MGILLLNVKLDSYIDSWYIFFPFHFAAQPTDEVTFPINHLVCPTYVKTLRSVFYFYFLRSRSQQQVVALLGNRKSPLYEGKKKYSGWPETFIDQVWRHAITTAK